MLLEVNILHFFALLNAIGGKGNFAFFKNTNFYLIIPMKVTHEEYPWIPKTLGNKRKLAFIFSSSFCRLIRNYLGLLHLPFWEFN